MKKMQKAYVKRVIGFFQLKPEELDATSEYFYEVFGFCEFLISFYDKLRIEPTSSDMTPELKITAGEAEIGVF